jgi:hypothetical protein
MELTIKQLRALIAEVEDLPPGLRDYAHGEFIGVDDEWSARFKTPVYVFKGKDPYRGTVSYTAYAKSDIAGQEWAAYNYTGSLLPKAAPKPESRDERVRKSFTKAWDEFFYELEPEDTGDPERPSRLKKHMGMAGWFLEGTVGSVGINNLEKNDVLTSQENNEFYQFVLGDGEVQKPGGRGKTKLTSRSAPAELHVWRRG